jgi:cephalosporin hydroxylase
MTGSLYATSYSRIHTDYKQACEQFSDIHEHVQLLSQYAALPTVNIILELGSREGISTIGWVWGLINKTHLITTGHTPEIHVCDLIITDRIRIIKSLCDDCGVHCFVYQGNDVDPELSLPKVVDLTFIDSMHNFPHMVEELKRVAPITRQYIIMHDTTIDAYSSEQVRTGADLDAVAQQTGYAVDDIKIGIWPAIVNFLHDSDGQWIMEKNLSNNNGLTVIRRCSTTTTH